MLNVCDLCVTPGLCWAHTTYSHGDTEMNSGLHKPPLHLFKLRYFQHHVTICVTKSQITIKNRDSREKC